MPDGTGMVRAAGGAFGPLPCQLRRLQFHACLACDNLTSSPAGASANDGFAVLEDASYVFSRTFPCRTTRWPSTGVRSSSKIDNALHFWEYQLWERVREVIEAMVYVFNWRACTWLPSWVCCPPCATGANVQPGKFRPPEACDIIQFVRECTLVPRRNEECIP
ncbi:hypothetical protein AcW1_006266 [Taiwanofungus camphoratus]|nr:hypothetical protein AcW1_006266 [Antrodia cinnamomea]